MLFEKKIMRGKREVFEKKMVLKLLPHIRATSPCGEPNKGAVTNRLVLEAACRRMMASLGLLASA